MFDSYEKTLEDSWGDEIEVATGEWGTVNVNTFRMDSFEFTPKKARKLAKALRKAAKAAERNA
jgi:hypothetical protein